MRVGAIGRACCWFAAAVIVMLATAVAGTPAAFASSARQIADSVPGMPGLPTGVPAAATAPEPALPEPASAEWPFPNNFSHTEGTGLVSGGASLWTDFLYDDHGPLGSSTGILENEQVSFLAPVHGGFTYPSGAADKNGADIFRAAVGYTPSATYWRVDWNTLADAKVPIAEWTFSTEEPTPVATETWPANAGVSSAGIQYALVVSSQHAELLDAATGTPVPGAALSTEVNMAAHSFIVRIPTSVLPVSGNWHVRLAAGLANAAGTEFETVPEGDGGRPGGSNVYNVTFRSYQQETALVCPTEALPESAAISSALEGELGAESGEMDHVPVAECGNFWMENDQANTLATGNVSKYALTVDWAQLAAKEQTGEPEPTGYSNRWYVTPLHLGEGIVDAEEPYTFTGPTYLGRVQPYAVYVPTTYNSSTPTPLTWILHSLGGNLNQYGGVAPTQLQEECEDRGSICATTEGFSDGQWYYGAAQVDFWDVWHQLASDYTLDPDATVMSGYSMGGFASYKLALEYPDLFAQSMPLEGPVICGERGTPPFELPANGDYGKGEGAEQCAKDGNTTPQIVNAKWVPYVMTYGAEDELVPFTGGVEQVEAFNELGYRYYAVLYPDEDHLAFAAENNFAAADRQLGHLDRVLDPASFTFTWYPALDSSSQGIGPSADYWISGLAARTSSAGQLAKVSADSSAIGEAEETIEHHTEAYEGAPPAVIDSLTWTPGAIPAPQQSLQLDLTDVAALTVDMAVDAVSAHLQCATTTVTSDGPTDLTMQHLRPNSEVSSNGISLATASAEGNATVHLPNGTTTLQSCSAPPPTVSAVEPDEGAETGGGTVTITGTNFQEASEVKFGSVQAASFKVLSDSAIEARYPPGSGTVDVTVTTPGGTSATGSADQFAYRPAPTVSGVDPDAGPQVGSSSVIITGTNLAGASEVKFGASKATSFKVNSESSIEAISPAGSGTVDVTVTTPGGTSATSSADKFAYVPSGSAPQVVKVSPKAGPATGGTSVTITGTGFTGVTAVRFGSSEVTSFKVDSESSIEAISPAGAAGAVDITVTTPNGTSATRSKDRFRYKKVKAKK